MVKLKGEVKLKLKEKKPRAQVIRHSALASPNKEKW